MKQIQNLARGDLGDIAFDRVRQGAERVPKLETKVYVTLQISIKETCKEGVSCAEAVNDIELHGLRGDKRSFVERQAGPLPRRAPSMWRDVRQTILQPN